MDRGRGQGHLRSASTYRLLVFFVPLNMTHRISQTRILDSPAPHAPPAMKWGRGELSQVSYNLETSGFFVPLGIAHRTSQV